MTRRNSTQPPSAFAIEFHSNDPERLVAFYENSLGVTFAKTTYPFARYIAEVGRFALIISDAAGHDGDTASAPGRTTLGLLSALAPPAESRPYFLYPRRVIGGAMPDRFAARMQDPDGNYVFLAPSMEGVFGRTPRISSWRELVHDAAEFIEARLWNAWMNSRKQWDQAWDGLAYVTGHVAVTHRDLGGFTHLVASREGLFAINTSSYKKIASGRFYGLTLHDGDIYCFQACGAPEVGVTRPGRGRIVRFAVRNGRIGEVSVTHRGLDDGCHQIDFVGDALLIVDCNNGRILKVRPGSPETESVYPLGPLSREMAAMEYHMNSIAAHPDGTYWVLLHNYLKKPSEIVVLDASFAMIRRFPVPAGAAHNIVFTNDAREYLVADSYGGRIVSGQGPVVEGGMVMPRGVSLDDTHCVFGESYFTTRQFRQYVPGRVRFFDRKTWANTATLELPAAPTEVRRIDGKDYSLSNYTLAAAAFRTGTTSKATQMREPSTPQGSAACGT